MPPAVASAPYPAIAALSRTPRGSGPTPTDTTLGDHIARNSWIPTARPDSPIMSSSPIAMMVGAGRPGIDPSGESRRRRL